MKKVMLVAFCLIGISMNNVNAENIVKARVTDAVIFLSGAELHQQATVSLQKGENEVRVENIAPDINRQSLKIALDNGVILTSYDYSIDYLTQIQSSKQVKALEDSVAFYTEKEKEQNINISTTKEMLGLLQTGINTSLTPTQQQLSPDAIEKNLTYYRNRRVELNKDLSKYEQQLTLVSQRKKDFQRQLNEEKKNTKQRCGVATLKLNSAKAQNCKIDLSYYTSSASWSPFYDIQIKKQNEPVVLLMKANVNQTTGLDWEKVKLTLSTGQPARQHEAPKLDTWFLREQQKYASGAVRSRVVAYEDSYAMEVDEEDAMMPMPLTAQKKVATNASIQEYVETQEQSLSREYSISLPYTIQGNGKKQTIALLEQEIKPENTDYKYLLVPKMDGGAYLTLNISDWQSLNLLNGSVNITNNNVFYGQTWINTSTTDKTLALTIGEDKQIVVRRELLQDFSQSKTIGSNKTTTKAYRITITNHKKEVIKCQLQEPYPISTAKNISVELINQTTPAAINDKDHGILTYEIELGAGESKEIVVGYSVKYPKEATVNL